LGIPADDLRTMTARNPAGLLGIETQPEVVKSNS
jgi:hypothetical protein